MAGVLKKVTFLVLVFAAVVFAEDHDVGDDTDWTRPSDPEFYAKWAATKVFRVGDELEFDFDAGRHDVAVVTQEAFQNCEKEKPLSLFTAPPVKIMLNASGPQYYICTIGDHCRFGQKLMVDVVGAGGRSGGGATPGPAMSVPGVGGTTTPGSSEPTPAGSTTPSGSGGTTSPTAGNAASSLLGGATILAAFVSAVVALF